jgi:hypothetical protein
MIDWGHWKIKFHTNLKLWSWKLYSSQRYLHPGEGKHQRSVKFINKSRARDHGSFVSLVDVLTDLKHMAFWREYRISKISISKNIYLEDCFIQWDFKQFCFEEIRIDILWEFGQDIQWTMNWTAKCTKQYWGRCCYTEMSSTLKLMWINVPLWSF